jgi:hypothetical protein
MLIGLRNSWWSRERLAAGYCALTFTLMPVESTLQRSVQVLGFDGFGHRTPLRRLIRFLFVRPALCFRLPSDSRSPTAPLPSANSSPCRVSRRLSPPSKCVLPGASKKNQHFCWFFPHLATAPSRVEAGGATVVTSRGAQRGSGPALVIAGLQYLSEPGYQVFTRD